MNIVLWISMSVIISYFQNFWSFLTVMILLGLAIAGYGGFKQVLTVEIFGVQNIASYIVFDQLITVTGAFIIPNWLVWISPDHDKTRVYKVSALAAIIWYDLAGASIVF